MIPEFDELGRLPPGIHLATWDEIASRFGGSAWRSRLLAGLRAALLSLKGAGCGVAYIDGSFVTTKQMPGDFDACWDEVGVDPDALDPVLLDFKNKRAAQKAKFSGELFPASNFADHAGNSFLNFFQVDKANGDRKGIVAIDLARWQP
ncbi:MAG: hypothetical protein WDO69_32655 [Pseudomonadota bacterium]